MKKEFYRKLSISTALASFGVGTLFFLIAKLYAGFYFLFSPAISFLITALLINLIILILVVIEGILVKNNRKSMLLNSIILISNIPLVVLYFYLLLYS